MKEASNRLQNSQVLLVGSGGLGSELALKLAGCRIGRITIVDGDTVSTANIPHSAIFTPSHVGQHKVDVVATFLREKFPGLTVTTVAKFIQQCDARALFGAHDLIVCAPDNDRTRVWVNYYAVTTLKRAVFVGIGGPGTEWSGYTFLYTPGESGCFVCFATGGELVETIQGSVAPVSEMETMEESRRRCGGENVPVPVLAPVVGVVAGIAATVIVKTLIGVGRMSTYTHIDLKQPRKFVLASGKERETYGLISMCKKIPTCIVCGKPEEHDLPVPPTV